MEEMNDTLTIIQQWRHTTSTIQITIYDLQINCVYSIISLHGALFMLVILFQGHA